MIKISLGALVLLSALVSAIVGRRGRHSLLASRLLDTPHYRYNKAHFLLSNVTSVVTQLTKLQFLASRREKERCLSADYWIPVKSFKCSPCGRTYGNIAIFNMHKTQLYSMLFRGFNLIPNYQ